MLTRDIPETTGNSDSKNPTRKENAYAVKTLSTGMYRHLGTQAGRAVFGADGDRSGQDGDLYPPAKARGCAAVVPSGRTGTSTPAVLHRLPHRRGNGWGILQTLGRGGFRQRAEPCPPAGTVRAGTLSHHYCGRGTPRRSVYLPESTGLLHAPQGHRVHGDTEPFRQGTAQRRVRRDRVPAGSPVGHFAGLSL